MRELIDRQAALDAIKFAELGREYDEVEKVQIFNPWHRVEDELPNDTRDVLAVRRYGNDLEKQEVIVAHLSVIMDMKRGFDKWWNATNITHWMSFPEPPKEDE